MKENERKKYCLSIREAAADFGIGESKLRNMISIRQDFDFILRNGNRVLIKRKKFEEYLDAVSSI